MSDINALVVLAGDAHPGLPIFMLGHSMGGLLAVQFALEHQDRLTGLMLSGALVALDAAPASARLIARILSVVVPTTMAAAQRFPQRVAEIHLPTLIMYGTADGLCPPSGSVMLGERIGAAT